MRNKLSFQIAFGGISTALCIVFMLLAGIVPTLEYASAMLCGLVIYIVAYECGVKTAVVAYASVSFLCVILSPNKESAMMFAGFYGYFPLLSDRLEKLKSKLLRWVLRFLVFNVSMLISYWLLIKVFGAVAMEEFGAFAWVAIIALNALLPLYNYWNRCMLGFYVGRLRKKFFKRK